MTCPHCSQIIHDSSFLCPICGMQAGFPNVTAANADAERTALDTRYDAAVLDATSRNADGPRQALEDAAKGSFTVMARYFGDVSELAYSEDAVYGTFYKRLKAGLRIPNNDKWNRLRAPADSLLFGETNKEEVRFGALTLDGSGLTNYGDWLLYPREDAISQRASVFEENSVTFFRRHKITFADDCAIPAGYRAPWPQRHRLIIAKLAARLDAATLPAGFPALLLMGAPQPEDDEFVEVHIWGGLTMRSMEKVSARFCKRLPEAVELKVLDEKLKQANVTLELP